MNICTLQITTRIRSKKNSKRVFRQRYTGRIIVLPSQSYETWREGAVREVKSQWKRKPISNPVHVDVVLWYIGKGNFDIDNMLGSIFDVLAEAGVIVNDRQIVSGGFAKKKTGNKWGATIEILEKE